MGRIPDTHSNRTEDFGQPNFSKSASSFKIEAEEFFCICNKWPFDRDRYLELLTSIYLGRKKVSVNNKDATGRSGILVRAVFDVTPFDRMPLDNYKKNEHEIQLLLNENYAVYPIYFRDFLCSLTSAPVLVEEVGFGCLLVNYSVCVGADGELSRFRSYNSAVAQITDFNYKKVAAQLRISELKIAGMNILGG